MSTSSDDAGAIRALYTEYKRAVESGDLAGYVRVLHPEVRLLPPGADAIVGAQNYARFLEPVMGSATYRIEVVRAPMIDVLGDVAYAEYDYVIHLTLKNPARGITEPGALTDSRTSARYLDVLRKSADGRWSIWRHAWQNKTD
jgi:uncharacterized protein (TIGR02246 family)